MGMKKGSYTKYFEPNDSKHSHSLNSCYLLFQVFNPYPTAFP